MSLFRRLMAILGAGGAGGTLEPDPEDFEFQATYGLRHAGWEPEYQGTLSEDIGIDISLIEESLWDAFQGTYGVRAT